MTKRNLNIAVKMILAGVLTIIVAYLLKIENYTTASAISILSIQITKRDFIEIALKRLISGLLAIVFASLLFFYFGQTFLMFAIFLIVFITLSWLLKAPEGIVSSTVLVTHLLTVTNLDISFVIDEILILIIAITIAFLFNMFYPEFDKQTIKKGLLSSDKVIEDQLIKIYHILTNKKINYEIDLKGEMNSIINNVEIANKNVLIQPDYSYNKYLYMRSLQLDILIDIENELKKLIINHHYQIKIASFIYDISENIGFDNNAIHLLTDLNKLKDFFKLEPLPKYRYEFELRAVLFIIINKLEQFLIIKDDFHKQYPKFIKERK